jgi:hypothetical protein
VQSAASIKEFESILQSLLTLNNSVDLTQQLLEKLGESAEEWIEIARYSNKKGPSTQAKELKVGLDYIAKEQWIKALNYFASKTDSADAAYASIICELELGEDPASLLIKLEDAKKKFTLRGSAYINYAIFRVNEAVSKQIANNSAVERHVIVACTHALAFRVIASRTIKLQVPPVWVNNTVAFLDKEGPVLTAHLQGEVQFFHQKVLNFF